MVCCFPGISSLSDLWPSRHLNHSVKVVLCKRGEENFFLLKPKAGPKRSRAASRQPKRDQFYFEYFDRSFFFFLSAILSVPGVHKQFEIIFLLLLSWANKTPALSFVPEFTFKRIAYIIQRFFVGHYKRINQPQPLSLLVRLAVPKRVDASKKKKMS